MTQTKYILEEVKVLSAHVIAFRSPKVPEWQIAQYGYEKREAQHTSYHNCLGSVLRP